MAKGNKKAGNKSNTTSNPTTTTNNNIININVTNESVSGKHSSGRHNLGGSGSASHHNSTTASDFRLTQHGVVRSSPWMKIFPESIQNYESTRLNWIVGCILLGLLLGYFMGAFWKTLGASSSSSSHPWSQTLDKSIGFSTVYQLLTFQRSQWDEVLSDFGMDFIRWMFTMEPNTETRGFERNPSHPRTFALLREAVIREKGGYVHPDLGFLSPAPCGAIRGLGMVDDAYHTCQTRCLPGSAQERLEIHKLKKACQGPCPDNAKYPIQTVTYHQEEILIRIPLSFQMTKSAALKKLYSLLPLEVQNSDHFQALDDAALLVLFLAHERGVGKYSKWYPYILSLPHQPSCGYSRFLIPHMLDSIEAMKHELGIDVEGWASELVKASIYADRIASGLNSDYGKYILSPPDVSSLDNIKWALCQVSSRATAGNEAHGALRMIPVLDLVNHDVHSGGFVEWTGKEKSDRGEDFFPTISVEDRQGMFVLSSLRHGKKRPLRKGQELMANYNVPLYTPLDWFISMGFVPPERWGPWQKVDPILPRVRNDGPFSEESSSTREQWDQDAPSVLKRIREAEKTWL